MYIRNLILPLAIILLTLLPVKSQELLSPPSDAFCCNIADCGLITRGAITTKDDGYHINGDILFGPSINNSTGNKNFTHKKTVMGEVIPYNHPKIKKSVDEFYWRCELPNGALRCLFIPNSGF